MVNQCLKNELRMHRWFRLPLTKLRTLEKQLKIESDGHHCSRETNIRMAEIEMEMVELHVEHIKRFTRE
jgi:hypothetical protein